MSKVSEKEEGKNDSHLTSAAAFVEGGIQEACDDSCSICLEAFCDSDPGTVLNFILTTFMPLDFFSTLEALKLHHFWQN